MIFDAVFRPTTVEDTSETVAQHFRMAIRREKERVLIADRLLLRPLKEKAMGLARCLGAMHHGQLNVYIAYVMLTLLLALVLGLV